MLKGVVNGIYYSLIETASYTDAVPEMTNWPPSDLPCRF